MARFVAKNRKPEINQQKIEKTSKKVLTGRGNDGIIVKLATERRTLKMIQSKKERKAQSINLSKCA